MIEATCENNTVKVGDLAIDGVTILSQGKKSSEGILILDGENLIYVATNATDIADLIQSMSDAITKLSSILTSIGAGMTGPTTAPPPTLPTDVLDLTQIVSDLTLQKDNLK